GRDPAGPNPPPPAPPPGARARSAGDRTRPPASGAANIARSRGKDAPGQRLGAARGIIGHGASAQMLRITRTATPTSCVEGVIGVGDSQAPISKLHRPPMELT